MKTKKQYRKNATDLEWDLEVVARALVDHMIQTGYTTADMKDRAEYLQRTFGAFLLRDIRFFADTWKYPEYAERGA